MFPKHFPGSLNSSPLDLFNSGEFLNICSYYESSYFVSESKLLDLHITSLYIYIYILLKAINVILMSFHLLLSLIFDMETIDLYNYINDI